jgi:hypothetical protein
MISPAMSSLATNPEAQIVTKHVGWVGGVNMRDAITTLAPDEARIMENGNLDEKGAFGKRLGCLSKGTVGATGERVLSMHTFYRVDLAPQILIYTSGGKIYFTADPTADPIVWTPIATGLSTTSPYSFETFNHKTYMSNGVDAYASWDGTTYTTYPAAPKGRYLRLWKDTMWVSGVTGLEDRVYSSDAGNAEVFGIASWVDIAHGDGDAVRALGTDGVYLIVMKRNRVFNIYDPGLFANRVVDFEKGCESHFSVVQFEGSIYYLSRRGICQYLGDSPSLIISGKVDPLFDPRVLNLNALDASWAYTVQNRVGWSLPEVGESAPTVQLEYYPRLAGVTPYGNRGVGPFLFHRAPVTTATRWRYQGNDFLYAGKLNANKVLQVGANVGTDDGEGFTATLESGAMDFGAPTRTKYIRRMLYVGRGNVVAQILRNASTDAYRSTELNMGSIADEWSLFDSWNEGSWGPDSLYKEGKWHPDAYGRYFQFRFLDTSTEVGRRLLDVGSRKLEVGAGEWAIYAIVIDLYVLGVRY